MVLQAEALNEIDESHKLKGVFMPQKGNLCRKKTGAAEAMQKEWFFVKSMLYGFLFRIKAKQ